MAQLLTPSGSNNYYDDTLDEDENFVKAINGEIESESDEEVEAPPSTQPSLKRRYESPEHDEAVYGEAHFGDFGEYMSRKRAKLQIQNAQLDSDASPIFQGLSIYINGWTQPSVQDLRSLIVKHGGVFQPYLVQKGLVTHIITCSLTAAKMHEFQNMKVVRPEWLLESAEQRILLPWKNYIFQHDERSEKTQGAKSTQRGILEHATRLQASLATNPIIPKPAPPPKPPAAPSTVPRYAQHESNPNAQRAMANPEWRKANTSAAPDFIEGYYKNSRLHHLSKWKAELKNLVQEAQKRAENSAAESLEKADVETLGGISMRGAEFNLRSPTKGKAKAIPNDEQRVIMHCDFDCFFVAAGLTKRPEHRGKPIVVCHSQDDQGGDSSTSEIASASYEARSFGIKNGMSLQQARQLCPTVMTIPYEFELYKRFSLKFYTILMSHADDLQAVSVDEALIDVTTTVSRLRSATATAVDPAKDFADSLRAQIKDATGCDVSIGISHNILLARLATRRAKPAGSFHLQPDEVPQLIAPLTITDLRGFGSSMKQKAQEKLGTIILGDLASRSKGALCDALGKATGETLFNAIRGIDHSKLESDKPRKSVSCEINYGIRFENDGEAEKFVFKMAVEVARRLDEVQMRGGSMTLKIMKRASDAPVEAPKFLGHGACDVFSKQAALAGPAGRATSDEKVIGEHVWRMLKSFHFDPRDLRGIGIQIQKLEPTSGVAPGPGQAQLQFGRTEAHVPVPGPSRVSPPAVDMALPSFSQVDMSVFNALPVEMREELQSEYKRRSETPQPPPQPPPKPVFKFPPPPPRNIFPSRRGGSTSRATRQFAPGGRGRGGPSPRKNFLFDLIENKKTDVLVRRHGVTSTRITEDDIRELGMDPEVFAMLPKNIRNEQLCRVRLIQKFGAVPEVDGPRQILKARKRPKQIGIFRRPLPKAIYLPDAIIRRNAGKTKLEFTTTEQIQDLVSMWVGGNKGKPPKEKDVEIFSKYLVKTVDTSECSAVGKERGIAVLKWWLVLLRRHWGSFEHADEADNVPLGWWRAFRQVKEKMDVVHRKRYGGKISLK
ncbi:hypothetical protein C8J56DRAFT_540169 [Mycena floridula]|nr:hypothetical protein C8J56DRAFT_540169 [Mycena floridula]